MLQFQTAANPQLGEGLITVLSLPEKPVHASKRALELNESELAAFTGAHFLGSWCKSPINGCTSFVGFLPNVMYKRGMPVIAYMAHHLRARWFAQDLLGDDWENGGYERAVEHKREMLRLLRERFGQEPKDR
jgi:hypothetical protein